MKRPRRKFLHLGAGAAALAAVSRLGWAQSYPTRPVRIVVPLPAGSSPDIRARIVAEQLTKMWGQQVIIENRPGGGGVIGVQAVLSAPSDGYTLLHAQASIFTVLPAQREKPRFDVNRDLIPIGLTANEGMVFAISPKLGINTLDSQEDPAQIHHRHESRRLAASPGRRPLCQTVAGSDYRGPFNWRNE
jgi:tripartite-type tricarboxylate transporter receptor subunit TctC